MARQILFCGDCREYTLLDRCPRCDEETAPTRPARYQPGFVHQKERREARREMLKKKGLL